MEYDDFLGRFSLANIIDAIGDINKFVYLEKDLLVST
jgi:hypothetical protein